MSDSLPPSPQSPPGALLPSPSEATTSTTSLPSAFDQTTGNLLKLGSLTMDKFAQDPSEELDGFDIPFTDPTNPHSTSYYAGDATATRHAEEAADEIPNVAPTEAVRFLREATTREFGATTTDPLKYEFFDELGQDRRSCILTITRPNSLSRSYRTKAEFARKSDAKVAAASSAIRLGAVHFIKYGEASNLGKRGLVLAKLDAGMKKDEGDTKGESNLLKVEPEPEEDEDDTAVSRIETCCIEWRAGSIIPKWVHILDPKLPNVHGYALKISLSTNIQRAYSVIPSEEYPTRAAAKAACALEALEQDVLEFIKHGDGLQDPIIVPVVGAEAVPPPPPPSVTTLQAFHAALPQPLPDAIGVKANGEINAVSWLNSTIQMAKGSRMIVTYNWYTDTKLGLHGCLLRLARPNNAPARSYLVDAIFSKRVDAKLAVCLLACSQGVGSYVREIAAEVDSRVTADMKRRATEQILPALGQALNRFKHGTRPEFSYNCEIATFDCTLTIDLSPDAETPVKKQWKVPLAYKSKADAKFAVTCLAADDGMIDFIKHRGKMPTDEVVDEAQVDVDLEEGETTMEGGKKKKKKGKKDATDEGADAEGGDEDLEAQALKKVRNSRKTESPFETREEALAKGRFGHGARKQPQRDFVNNGRGRGSAFGNRGGFGGNARGATGFGPQRHPPGVSSGFFSRSGLRTPIPPSNVPPFFAPGFIHPAYGPGYPGGAYGADYGHLGRGYLFQDRSDPGIAHARHVHGPGVAGANAATPFVHAPPPVPPHVAPGYGAYNERARNFNQGPQPDYRSGPHAPSGAVPLGPSGQPYSLEHRSAAPVLPQHPYQQPGASGYNHMYGENAGRPAHSAPHAHEGHYAPDYDRIPDRSSAVPSQFPSHKPSHASPSQSLSSSHSHGSIQPRNLGGSVDSVERRPPTEPRSDRAKRAAAQTVPEIVREGDEAYEHVPHHDGGMAPTAPPALSQPSVLTKPVSSSKAEIEKELNSVISRLEKEADEKASRGDPNPRSKDPDLSRSSSHKSTPRNRSRSLNRNEQTSVKRGRSSDKEGNDSQPNKRRRERSKSISQPSEPESSRSTERVGHDPSSGRNKSIVPEETGTNRDKVVSASEQPNEKKSLKRAREVSPGREKQKDGEQKRKSYVTALFDHCDKEGIPRPEFGHEELTSELDGDGKAFKVYIVMGKERMELPKSFKTLDVAQERVAKSVLGKMRMEAKRRKLNSISS